MFSQRINIAIIGIFALLLAGSIYAMKNLSFVYDFESFYPEHNEVIEFYDFFREQFEPSDNFVMIGVQRNEGTIFDSTFLAKLDQFTHELDSALPTIVNVESITTLKRPLVAAGAIGQIPVVRINRPEKYQQDSAKIAADPRVIYRFVDPEMKSTAVLLKTQTTMTLRETYDLQETLDEVVAKYDFDEDYIAGRFYYQAIFSKRSKNEFLLYTVFSAAIMFIVLTLLFKKFWGVVLSTITVLVGMGIFIGLLGVLKFELDPMANLFPILMVIVGISDVIHIMTKYIDEHNKGIGRKRAIRVTVREIGMATFLTSATTAIGFASLITSDMPPLQSFGLMSAVGVLMVYGTVLLLAPSLLSLMDISKIIRRKKKKGVWDKLMQRTYLFTWRQQNRILVVAVLFIGICILGINQIGTDTHVRSSFPRYGEVIKDFDFLEEGYGGVRNMDIAIIPADSAPVTDYAILKQIDTLEQHLAQKAVMGSPLSPTMFYKTINQGRHGDNPDYYELPDSESEYRKVHRLVNRAPQSSFNILLSEDRKYGRLTMKYPDVGSDSGKVIRKDLRTWIDQHTDTSVVRFELTGTPLVFDKNSDNVRGNMAQGLGIAFLLVSLLMVLLFRNIKMLFISLIPNVIPLLFGGALIGFFGIELDASTSIIFALAFGIAVDDTIHFLSKFKLEIDKGKMVRTAIRATYRESGKAICLTTLILFLGFSILVTSAYPPTFYIGLLLSAVLLIALITDLLVAPVLIYKLMGYDTVYASKKRHKKPS